ncbi:MAG: High-affinity branched-chain amino acid transport ATP-binding protein LivF [Actinomycetota bacterium]
MTSLLQVSHLTAGYGDFKAVFDVDVQIESGETIAIVGANGAGKSTLLRAIMGQVRIHAGSVFFRDKDLAAEPTSHRSHMGLAMVPEGRRLFPSLTVRENLQIGATAKRQGPWNIGKVVELFPLIDRLMNRSAAKLSGGEQQAIAIGRALMGNPELLLFDEVSLGLAPVVVKQLYAALPEITREGTTAVVVEQDIHQALAVSDRVYCLLEGRISLTGRSSEIGKSSITKAYFGEI